MMKKILIMQSNYIPWKGYFDMIALADEFIIFDEMQYTKNDWRNRNRIKTPQGPKWLTIPVGINIDRKIRDVTFNRGWESKHWRTLELNYSRAKYYDDVASWLEPIYISNNINNLTEINLKLIKEICKYLEIKTEIKYSWEYKITAGRSERLINLCMQAGGTHYISGPSAEAYISKDAFAAANLPIIWFDYSKYPEYPQLWGSFINELSILDLLFNCGKKSNNYMKFC